VQLLNKESFVRLCEIPLCPLWLNDTASLNIWIAVILIALFSGNTYAQPSHRDSLRSQIEKETNDTTRIKLMIQYALIYPRGQEKYNLFKDVHELSLKNNYRHGLMYDRYVEGMILVDSGKYDEAIDKYKRCIDGLDSLGIIPYGGPLSEIRILFNLSGKQEEKFRYYTDKVVFYQKHGPIENTADCFHGIAGYYHDLADYDKAIEYYLRAREVYKTFNPYGYENEGEIIGTVYKEWGNLDKAEIYLKSSLRDLAEMNDMASSFYCYHQLGDICFLRQDYKQALQFYIEGKQYYTEPAYQAINLVSIAAVHLELGSVDSARLYLESAEKIRQREQLKLSMSNGDFEIDYTFYKYFIKEGNDDLALKSLKAALNEAQSSHYLIPYVLKYTNELHYYLLNTGDSLQALSYLIRYYSIQDSLNRMNTRARIASYEIEQQQQEKENEIEQLQVQKSTQRNYYLIGGALIVLIIIAGLNRLLYKRKRDELQLHTEFKKQLAQAETKALRAQMNPHFIFNCLNSINSMVIDQKHEIASDYLIKFSKLIRLILDNSRSEIISLEKELEALKLYVVLESARFDNKFKCIYSIAEDVNTNSIMIPPMLLQPFVENAIWHGLMQKEGEGTITVEIKKENEEFLNISISDDGIGRDKAAELKSKSATHRSHGLKVTSQRIDMMNKLNSTGAQVNISDLKDDKGAALGTRVEVIIPF
jgi:hypothetical protein